MGGGDEAEGVNLRLGFRRIEQPIQNVELLDPVDVPAGAQRVQCQQETFVIVPNPAEGADFALVDLRIQNAC